MGNLFTDLFTNDNEEKAAAEKAAGLKAGQTAAYGALDTGLDKATGYYDKALLPFADLLSKGTKGYDTYQDATGVNGQPGIDRAGSLYKSMPGYSAGQTTGLDLLERRAAARGDLSGGNTSADTIRFASDYDSGKYKDFLSSLMPNLTVASGAASGTAGVYGREGDLTADFASKKAGYGYGTEKGIGDANAEATMGNEKSSSNFWSALLGGAGLALKGFGVGGFAAPSYPGATTLGGPTGPKAFY